MHEAAESPGQYEPGHIESGFTLLELIVVLGILALAASLAFPRVQGTHTASTLDTTARRLTSALQLAHAESRRTNTDQTLIIDVDHATFWSSTSPTPEAIPKPIALAIQDDSFEWSGTNRRIRFSPSGSATGGVIALASGNARARITVDWLTGAATLATSH
jgi:general secretion pathway protein H